MEKWEVQLSTILNDTLRPMEFALFYNDNKGDDYQCIFTNFDRYEGEKEYDLYSIPSLIRVLTLKNQIVADGALNQVYKEPAKEAAFVLEWGSNGRKVMIFNTERPKIFDQDLFVESVTHEQENLKKLFNRILHS